jgi:hypothetical protein
VVDPPILSVQPPHPAITDQLEAQFGPGFPGCLEDSLHKPFEQTASQGDAAESAPDDHLR